MGSASCSPPTDPLRQDFDRDGFAGPIDVLTPAEVGELRQAVAEVIADLDRLEPRLYEVERAHAERPHEVVCHFLGGWLVHERLRQLVFDARATGPAARVLGVASLRLFHDQVFAKPPHHPGVVPWHQDYSYWTRTAPAQHVTVNLMLDDADEHNGCLMFVPGSHRWPLLPKLPFDAPLEAVRAHLPADAVFAPVTVPVRAGQATLHHSHTLHGSGPNRSSRWRRAVVLNYVGPAVRVADGDAPLLRGVEPLPVGAALQGRFFPMVLPFDRAAMASGDDLP